MLHFLVTAVVFLAMITVLVAAHEYGHYLFARLNKMEVEEFAIGLGPKPLFTWMRRGGTNFTVRPLPFGGFVRIKGMVPEEDGSETKIEHGFYNKAPLARLLVLFAGPLFSVLAGIAMLGIVYVGFGEVKLTNQLGEIVQGEVADKAGLRMGDRIIAIDGRPTPDWATMTQKIKASENKRLTLLVERNGRELTIMVTPRQSENEEMLLDSKLNPTGQEAYVGFIGVHPAEAVNYRVPVGTAISDAASTPINVIKGLVATMHTPKQIGGTLGGPATIAAATSDSVKGGPQDVIGLAGMLSISLGILNLLPVYPLDGGQMVVAFAELLRRGRRLSYQIQNMVGAVGLALVGMLIVAVLFIDARRFIPSGDQQKPPAIHKAIGK